MNKLERRRSWMHIVQLFVTLCLFFPELCYANAQKSYLRYYQTDTRFEYRVQLLKLALEKTEAEFGQVELKVVEEDVTQSRGLMMLEDNALDIVFLAANTDRMNRFRAIPIPLLRGMLGYRVLMIHQDRADSFAGVESLPELTRRFEAGFGSHWIDLEILEQNHIRVQPIHDYDSLFTMLDTKRFDYFPRGINEVWGEMDSIAVKYPHLMVEKSLALMYPYPVYFFVSKENQSLAMRIEKGLTLALEDGTFKQLFNRYHRASIDRANLQHRRIFELENNTLPYDTPAIDTSWWLKSSD